MTFLVTYDITLRFNQKYGRCTKSYVQQNEDVLHVFQCLSVARQYAPHQKIWPQPREVASPFLLLCNVYPASASFSSRSPCFCNFIKKEAEGSEGRSLLFKGLCLHILFKYFFKTTPFLDVANHFDPSIPLITL